MDNFQRYLQFQRDITESVLNVIKRYQEQAEILPEKSLKPVASQRLSRRIDSAPEGTSKIDLVEKILIKEGRPLHIGEIVEIAMKDHNLPIERDSIVSMLVKKLKAGKNFIRTGPNTFALKGES
jgi:hypothetical protein